MRASGCIGNHLSPPQWTESFNNYIIISFIFVVSNPEGNRHMHMRIMHAHYRYVVLKYIDLVKYWKKYWNFIKETQLVPLGPGPVGE